MLPFKVRKMLVIIFSWSIQPYLFLKIYDVLLNFLLQVFLFSSLLALATCLSTATLPKDPIEPRDVDIITVDPKETTSKIEPRNGKETTSKPCPSPPCCPNCPPGRWGCYCQFYHDPRRSDQEAEKLSDRKETRSHHTPCFEPDPPCCPSCPPGYIGCYCENYHEPRSEQEASNPWITKHEYWILKELMSSKN